MSELKNDRFLRALLRQPVDRTPVWMMRQAGRYLPEYRATREQAGSFLDLCKNDELACEVTLQPLRRYPMDAAILFCDILIVLDAMGVEVRYEEGGPVIRPLVRDREQVDRLTDVDAERDFPYVKQAVEAGLPFARFHAGKGFKGDGGGGSSSSAVDLRERGSGRRHRGIPRRGRRGSDDGGSAGNRPR